MSSLVPLDLAAFESGVLAARGRYAVLFSAPWCGPCGSFAPLLQRVADATGLAIAKVDVDADPELAARYGVRSVPTLVLFEAGAVAARQVGTLPEGALRRFLGDAA